MLESSEPSSHLSAREGFWQADGLTEYTYNPDKARELLKEAGWDGSYTLRCVYYTGNLLDTITAIQQYWSDVGVKMEFQLLTDNLSVLLWTPSADGIHSAVDWDICFAGTNALTREWTDERSLRRPDLGFRVVFEPR